MDCLVELLIENESLDGVKFRDEVSKFCDIPDKERFSPLLPAAASRSMVAKSLSI
jgi:cell division protease FtsH